MEFANLTEFPAAFLQGSTGNEEMVGIAACKVTYRLEEEGLVPVGEEDAWPIFEKQFVYNNVTLGPELDFRKQYADLFVFGKARTPNQTPMQALALSIECGSNINWKAKVFGDRIWQRSKFKLVPSIPRFFTEMDLTNDKAFGGKAKWNGEDAFHSINPDGMGWYIDEKEARDNPLPNVESPGALIQKWHDQPVPACLYRPKGFAFPEGAEEVLQDEEGQIQFLSEMMTAMFQQAVPELVAPADALGDQIKLNGFCADGPLSFPVPPLNGPCMHVAIGRLKSRFPSRISSIIILVDERVLIVTYRCLFRYLFQPLEKRHAELKWLEGPSIGNVHLERKPA